MLNQKFFVLRLEAGWLPSEDADFKISSPIHKEKVIDDLTQRLDKIGYLLDLDSLTLTFKENQLHFDDEAMA